MFSATLKQRRALRRRPFSKSEPINGGQEEVEELQRAAQEEEGIDPVRGLARDQEGPGGTQEEGEVCGHDGRRAASRRVHQLVAISLP